MARSQSIDMRSQFQFDLTQEQMLQPFLDRCYKQYAIEPIRYQNRNIQRNGIDLTLSRDGYSFLVDEKAQLGYIGRSLPCFALEINSYGPDGRLRTGWLFDEQKKTEVYAFVFDIRLHAEKTRIDTPEEVAGASIVLVNRHRLINHLERGGLDRFTLTRQAEEMRRTGALRRYVPEPGWKLAYSEQLAERPVNLLVKRKFLMTIGQVLRRIAA